MRIAVEVRAKLRAGQMMVPSKWRILPLLAAAAAGCAPDDTSFATLDRNKQDRPYSEPVLAGRSLSRAGGNLAGGAAALPASIAEATSLDQAIVCIAALKVTQQITSNSGLMLGTQGSDAIKQAETMFQGRADDFASRSGASASPEIERKTQELLKSPDEAAQQALACLRTLMDDS